MGCRQYTDCEALTFNRLRFSYRGNQALIAEPWCCPAFEKLATLTGATFIGNEPVTLGLDPDCRLQCRVNVETRTNAYQIRTGDLEEQVSVYVTARQYGGLSRDTTYVAVVDKSPNLPGTSSTAMWRRACWSR
jgi:hypothetical protein